MGLRAGTGAIGSAPCYAVDGMLQALAQAPPQGQMHHSASAADLVGRQAARSCLKRHLLISSTAMDSRFFSPPLSPRVLASPT